MTRKRRSDEQHGWFHITTRGVDRQDIFSDDIDRDRFLVELARAARDFDVEVHAFSLMSNHVHLLVHCPDGGVSKFVQQVLRRYVEFHNPRVGRVGHLFGGRFTSTIIIDTDQQDATAVFQQMGRYVHRNALDRLLIGELAADPYSSYGVYLGAQRCPEWLHTDRLLATHDNDRERLRRFTEEPHPSDKTPREGRDIVPYRPDEVIAAVAAVFDVDVETARDQIPGCRNRERDVAAHLAMCWRTGTASELATAFGFTGDSAFFRCAARGKDLLAIDPNLGLVRSQVAATLWANHLGAPADPESRAA